MKKKTKYIHTIDGHPAIYRKNEQIVFLGGRALKVSEMADSLEQIREEQRLSTKWRTSKKFVTNSESYHYFRIMRFE